MTKLVIAWFAWAAVVGAAVELPRYRFSPATEYAFSSIEKIDQDDYHSRRNGALKLWVVSGSAAEGWRGFLFGRSTDVPTKSSISWLTALVFHADGRFETEDPIDSEWVLVFLPRLPADEQELANGWTEHDPNIGYTIRYHYDSPTHFSATESFSVTSVSPSHLEYQYVWNPEGLVTNSQFQAVAGTKSASDVAVAQLERQTEIPAPELLKLQDEAAAYRTAFTAYLQANAKAWKASYDSAVTGDQLAALLADAKQALLNGQAQISRPEMAMLFEDALAMSERDAHAILANAQNVAGLLNRPVPAWTATGIDGKVYRSSDYAGQVVVLDFWKKNCGPCLAEIPDLKQLASEFAGRPFSLLGMDIVDNAATAQTAAAQLQLNYPVLLASDLIEPFGIFGTPTLVVVDKKGIVRSNSLAGLPLPELTKLINQLLSE